jgi:hypothetical protein
MIYDFLSSHSIFFQITYAITLTNAAFFIGKLITQNNNTNNIKMHLYQMKLEQLIYKKLQILETKLNLLLLKHNMIEKECKDDYLDNDDSKQQNEDEDENKKENDVTVSFMEQIDKNNIQHDYISQLLLTTSSMDDSNDYITIHPEQKIFKDNHFVWWKWKY